ncbi:MAG: hypothetical protein QNJ70_15825 [Xenococcaceae cyanobacterium MO_207.B15]|nr:hypothetical protein [Xenococcaceae cyanobacterium MO_207.B15]
MDFFKPSLEQLVTEIVAVNHAWKEAKQLFGHNSNLAISLREIKSNLQVRLLRNYAPEKVYLMEDKEADTEESLYGLLLVNPIKSYKDAAHLPIRVAIEKLSIQEREKFVKF